MKKLRLDVVDVQVESFTTATGAGVRGTVRAKSDSLLWCNTFEDTCWNTGCNTGYTAPDYCQTADGATCPGWADCGPGSSDGGGYTCENSCSDYGCTVCHALC